MKNQFKIEKKKYLQLTDGSIINIDYISKNVYFKLDVDIRSHKIWQFNKTGLSLSGAEEPHLLKFKKKFSFNKKRKQGQ
uniref:Ribosomal protein L31 n=1 Tax=Proteomonas sulcata TaxID=77928 RepID=A0A2P1G8D3_9CRYP|nr:hypothetical protein PsulMt_p035 [Proteomonas sulcata]AVM81211.1 hypothetical protein PsulMt_p035 [Proteomonas sulcata]